MATTTKEKLLAQQQRNRGYEARLASHQKLREELILSATDALQKADAELVQLEAAESSAAAALRQQEIELRRVQDVENVAYQVHAGFIARVAKMRALRACVRHKSSQPPQQPQTRAMRANRALLKVFIFYVYVIV